MFYQVAAERVADKPQTDSSQDQKASHSQTSTFQLFTNVFRRIFSPTNPSSTTVTMFVGNVEMCCRPDLSLIWLNKFHIHCALGEDVSVLSTRRTKGDGLRKQRPVSDLSSLSSSVAADSSRGRQDSRLSVGADLWGAGSDLPFLLQQVSLPARRGSGAVFSDDMASLPRRRVNLFSSLRLRKRKESQADGQDQEVQQEIRTILGNLRRKGQSIDSQPQLFI